MILGLKMPKGTKLSPWFYRRYNQGSEKLSDFSQNCIEIQRYIWLYNSDFLGLS